MIKPVKKLVLIFLATLPIASVSFAAESQLIQMESERVRSEANQAADPGSNEDPVELEHLGSVLFPSGVDETSFSEAQQELLRLEPSLSMDEAAQEVSKIISILKSQGRLQKSGIGTSGSHSSAM